MIKNDAFFENSRLLQNEIQIIPLLYGSLGLEYLTKENLDADDIDILIPGIYLSEQWATFCAMLKRNGYRLIDEHEHTFEKNGIHLSHTELGIMIETPSSVFVADELAKLVDFFSVGTNDLTQYTLACDRQANDPGKFYDPHHPALLRAIKMAADAAHKAGIWIGICGELGADISMLPTFLAIGIDELSVSPAAGLPVRAAIRQSIAQTCTLEMLEC